MSTGRWISAPIPAEALPTLRACFEARVQRQAGCWGWAEKIGPDGYCRLVWPQMLTGGKFRSSQAHRVAYALFRGDLIEGLTLDHLCRNRACVNPDHLEQVTLGENVLRGVGPAAEHARQTHCSYGHEFTPENTRVYGRQRRCVPCQNRTNRAASAARTQARLEALCASL